MAKEQQIYLQALEHALKIAQDNGIEELEREVRYRSQRKVPLNVSRQELIACAREFAHEELYIIATAMAKTLAEHVKLPMSMLKDYLKHFNDLVAVYHADNDKYKADQKELSVDYRLNEMCREYTEENGI